MKTDILIVGGGIVGLMGAWRLAQAGRQVCVVEQYAPVHGQPYGSASVAALGALVPYPPHRTEEAANAQRESLATWPQVAQELEAATGLPTYYHNSGRWQWVHTPAQAESAAHAVQANSQQFSMLNQAVAQQQQPSVNVPTEGVLHCTATATVSPPHVLAALYQACMQAGVKFAFGKAEQLLRDAEHVTGVQLATQKIYAAKTVLAMGWQTPLLDGAVAQVTPVTPVLGQVVRYLLPEGMAPLTDLPMLRCGSMYVVAEAATGFRSVLVGATKENRGHDARPTQKSMQQLHNKACDLWPVLDELIPNYTWVGLRPKVPRGQALLQAVPQTHNTLYTATGHGGIGLCLAPHTGRALVRMVG